MDAFKIALWVILIPIGIGVVVTVLLVVGRGVGNGLGGWKQSRNAQAMAKWDLLADDLDEGEDHE